MKEVVAKILDVSKWNVKTDLDKFNEEGFSGIIIRAGCGKNSIDIFAERFYKQALDLEWDIGFYWFSYAKCLDDAVKEANYLLDFVKGKTVTLPLVYDYEGASKLGKYVPTESINEYGKAFCEILESKKYYAMFYSNHDYYKRVWDMEMKERYDCWYARYTKPEKALEFIPNLHLHQYGTSHRIGSTLYSQDVNNDYIGLSDLIRTRGLAHNVRY